jgi:plastocyanin
MVLKAVIIDVSILAIILASILVGGAVIIGKILENDPYIRNEILNGYEQGEESVQAPQDEISSLPVTEEGKVVSIVGNSGGNSYKPEPIGIKVGDRVTWINNDSSLHTATSTSSNDSNFDSKVLRRGETFSFTFDREGQYPYFGTIHPNMVGSVVVLPSSGR